MSGLSQITILLHTSNRPHFLLRMLDHFERSTRNADRPKIMLLDASGEEAWRKFEREAGRRSYSFDYEVFRAERETPFQIRIADALSKIETPYAIFAADDDFYFFDWMSKAANVLDSEPAIGTVYGHMMTFELERFVPYGNLASYAIHRRSNPPIKWLEDDSAYDRLMELSSPDFEPATTGWYSLQRTENLRETMNAMVRYGLPTEFIEYWFIFTQAALGKTRMLDAIAIARQIDAKARHNLPKLSKSKAEFETFKHACRDFLVERHFDPTRTHKVVDAMFEGTEKLMRMSTPRRLVGGLINRHAVMARLWRVLRGQKLDWEVIEGAVYPDPRFPKIPQLDARSSALDVVRDGIIERMAL